MIDSFQIIWLISHALIAAYIDVQFHMRLWEQRMGMYLVGSKYHLYYQLPRC